jgi:hypothetical protein
VAIVVGAAVLAISDEGAYTAAWVLFVVGAHFVPLGRLFRIGSLQLAGVILVVISIVATLIGLIGTALPSAAAPPGGTRSRPPARQVDAGNGFDSRELGVPPLRCVDVVREEADRVDGHALHSR